MAEEVAGVETGQVEGAEEPFKPPSPPGRPRKDGLPAGSVKPDASLCPNPRFKRYISDHDNPNQRSEKLWKWWAELPENFRNLMAAYVYREYPPLLDPGDNDGYKYIDVVVTPFENDTQFTDMYGAGTYKVFLNIGEKENKRTLAEAVVRGHRDFKSQPPSDKRITQLDETGKPKWIDMHDPMNQAYIEFLRSRGVLPEVWAEERKQREMADATITQKLMDRVETLTEKLIDNKESKPPGYGSLDDMASKVINTSMAGAQASQEMLKDTIKTLREMQLTGNGGADVTAMMNMAIQIAGMISKANDPSQYLTIISDLNKSITNLKVEQMNSEIRNMRDQMAAAIQSAGAGTSGNGQAPNPATSIRSMIEDFKAVQELVGGGGDDGPTTAKMPAWMGLITALAQPASQIVGNIVNAYIVSRMPPGQAPMPQAQPLAQPQPTGPVPMQMPQATTMAQPQPQPNGPGQMALASPTTPLPNPMNPSTIPASTPVDAVAQLMSTISGPFLNMFMDNQGGDDFADWFIGGYGEELYREITVTWPRRLALPPDRALLMAIDNYPPMAQALMQEPREQVEKFVQEFVGFDAEAYDRKQAVTGGGSTGKGGPLPVA